MERARVVLTDACAKVGLPAPDEAVVEQTAKIIGALGEERVPRDLDGGPHKLWLLTEGFINAGKDPSPIHEAALSSLLDGKPEARTNSPEAINKKIGELEAKAVMPAPKKPEDTATPEQIMEYRSQLATRHIRERLGKRHGVYSAGNMENLYEVMMTIADSQHPDFNKLYDDVALKLTMGGAQVDRWLTNVKEAQLKDITEIIATSKVPIREETSKERYLHAQQSPELRDYVARDLTIEYEISDLYQQLPR
jgi:hypothetical protein